MIKIKKIEEGIFPYGSGFGMRMGHIHFEVDGTSVNSIEEAGKKLIEDYENKVKESGFENFATRWYCGKAFCVISESGDSNLSSRENLPIFDELYVYLSKKSWEQQKAFGLHTQMNALPISYFGTPKEYSGTDQFFERFNLIYINADTTDNYNALAEAEALRVPNSTLLFFPKSKEDVDKFLKDHVRTELQYLSSKFVAIFNNRNPDIELMKYCSEKGLRLSLCIKNENFLSLK